MAHELPPLPYPFDALEPHIDAQTMQIHHDRHHAAYVNNLNAALEKHRELQDRDLEGLLRGINSVPEDIRTAVRNHGGGHHNHSLFWQIMGPNGGGAPSGVVAQAFEKLGGFDEVKKQVTANGVGRFGSGWSWIALESGGNLWLGSTANQDSPLMDGRTPILGIDVWEHAYYLKYQWRRPDYLNAWWNTVNWAKVEELYRKAGGR
ncbi:MAG TPA: superoxide dismutase [Chloroflexota bacterium]|jgi:Fe-Mn family superoxide dismutase|nr:superoxide dismutase [Chloroflexota bacterium]